MGLPDIPVDCPTWAVPPVSGVIHHNCRIPHGTDLIVEASLEEAFARVGTYSSYEELTYTIIDLMRWANAKLTAQAEQIQQLESKIELLDQMVWRNN